MRPLIAMALFALMLAGCSKSVDPKTKSFVYPLAMGNRWVYDYQTITDFRGKKPNDTVTYSSTVEVVQVDTILPGICSYTLRATSTFPDSLAPLPAKQYVNLPDGMYLRHSSTGTSMVLPKQYGVRSPVMFRGRQYENLQTLLTTLIEPPELATSSSSGAADSYSLILPYPQSLGQRWTRAQVDDDQVIGLDMKIIGSTTAKNSAGSFECHVIQWIYVPPVEDLDVADFTSAEGLIQRRIEARNLIMTSYEFPYGGDTADVVSTYQLTSFHIH